jgi:predicted transcriptional regulator
MDTIDTLIKTELFKNLDSFVNELSLTMDYISPESIKKYEQFIVKLKNDHKVFNDFTSVTYNHLSEFEVKFSGALFSNKKVKTNYYDFLNNVFLFPTSCQLKFDIFKDESKATKKAFVSYLYNIYLSCVFLTKYENLEDKENDMSKELTDFIDKIKKEAESAVTTEYEKVEKVPVQRRNAISGPSNGQGSNPFASLGGANVPQLTPEQIRQLPGLGNLESMMGGMGNMGGLGGIMSSILGNQEILNIASDISHQMSTQQLDPMSMLTSLMSGNIENSPLNGLVSQIQQKVEMKIESGEIDKSELENQAQNIMNNIDPSQFSSMPGMADMMKTMAENLQQGGSVPQPRENSEREEQETHLGEEPQLDGGPGTYPDSEGNF